MSRESVGRQVRRKVRVAAALLGWFVISGGCAVMTNSSTESSKNGSVVGATSGMATTRPASVLLPSGAFVWDQIPMTQTAVGQRRSFFDSPTRTLDQLELHVTTLNPGQAPHAPHQHPDEELILIKEGTLEATINGHSQVAGPGSAFFFASGDLHGLRNVGQTQATYFVLRWFAPGKKPKAG